MPVVYFGLAIGERSLPQPSIPSLGEHRLDTKGLLQLLESYYGLGTKEERTDYLRVEQYRQLLQAECQHNPNVFFSRSFSADPLASSQTLLEFRDELLAAGYPLHLAPPQNCPPRIALLHQVERNLLAADSPYEMLPGEADRIVELLSAIRPNGHPPLAIFVHEPEQYLPPGAIRILKKLRAVGDWVQYLPLPSISTKGTDLNQWQKSLIQESWAASLQRENGNISPPGLPLPTQFLNRCSALEANRLRQIQGDWLGPYSHSDGPIKASVRADGSLIILRAKRETHLAAYLAKILRDNASWQPNLIMTRKRQTLANALRMEGLPSLGVPSSSLARPSLQVLKLVTSFLWEPIDLRKLMEFLTLGVKPLNRVLGYRLAAALTESPGLYSEAWFIAHQQFFEQELPRLADRDPAIDSQQVKQQYDFWFKRTRYEISAKAPKTELHKIFVFLVNWVRQLSDAEKTDSTGLHTLAAQAERAVVLIDTLAEEELSPLEVERIVRTVYEPAPAQFHPEELGRLSVAFGAASIFSSVDELVWWDFAQEDPEYFFSRWYRQELSFLASGCWSDQPESAKIQLLGPDQKNELLAWSEARPVLHCNEQLLICLPDRIEGSEVLPHNLWGGLNAIFGDDIERLIVEIDQEHDASILPWELPQFDFLKLQTLAAPRPFVHISEPDRLQSREKETPTSLEDYIYHPHLWVFRHGTKIKAINQLSLRLGSRLRGKLAHRFIERLFAETNSLSDWTKPKVFNWVKLQEVDILRKEGGLLLEYGAEPDRVQFRRQIQRAAWALVAALQEDNWTQAKVELDLQGQLDGLQLKGRADLVLTGNDGRQAIIDLKWRGKTKFSNLIRNQEDLQLTLYALMLHEKMNRKVSTAYFILSESLLLARNQNSFQRAEAIDPDSADEEIQKIILTKMRATLDWRNQQLQQGLLEIRCSETIAELEEAYQDLDYDKLLEMRENDAPFDDYRALIGLIR